MEISCFVATNGRDGYHKGDARCGPSNQTDDSADFDVINEDSDEEASGYGDVLGLTTEDINRMVFRTEQRAYKFYLRLGKCHEFVIRKGDYGKDENGNLIHRKFFCNQTGYSSWGYVVLTGVHGERCNVKPPCSRVADAQEGNWLRLDRSSCGRMWRIGPWLDGLHVWPWIWVGRGGIMFERVACVTSILEH
ncbi:hypothetical protein AHAS_Ahas18G0114200 [Arachis hypogaea]